MEIYRVSACIGVYGVLTFKGIYMGFTPPPKKKILK